VTDHSKYEHSRFYEEVPWEGLADGQLVVLRSKMRGWGYLGIVKRITDEYIVLREASWILDKTGGDGRRIFGHAKVKMLRQEHSVDQLPVEVLLLRGSIREQAILEPQIDDLDGSPPRNYTEHSEFPYPVGEKLFVRAEELHHVGRVVEVGEDFVRLREASFVQHSHPSVDLAEGFQDMSEIKRAFRREVLVRFDVLLDAFPWVHELPEPGYDPSDFFARDGVEWSKEALWEAVKGLPVRMEKVADLLGDEKIVQLRMDYQELMPRSFFQTLEKAQQTDLSYPIILTHEGRLADGCHRLIKAYLEKREEIAVVQLEEMPTPTPEDKMMSTKRKGQQSFRDSGFVWAP
jgi:hypothetical protein